MASGCIRGIKSAVFWPEEFLFHQVTFGLYADRTEAQTDVWRHTFRVNV